MLMSFYISKGGTQLTSDCTYCREGLLGYIENYCHLQKSIRVVVKFSHINKLLVLAVVKDCKSAEKLFKSFEINEEENAFIFELSNPERQFFHFISFLCLLNDVNFSTLKIRTKKRSTKEFVYKSKIEISDAICNVIDKHGLHDFSLHSRGSLKGYITEVVENNNIIEAKKYCNGPETAYDFR